MTNTRTYGIRTESRYTSDRLADHDTGTTFATTREDRDFGSPGTNYPVLVGETSITTYWHTPSDGGDPYLVVDIDTSGNATIHGGDGVPVNLKVTVNDGYVFGDTTPAPPVVEPPARELTPYDRGEVLEPKPWTDHTELDNFGLVDFDNDCGETELTLRVRVVRETEFHGRYLEVDIFDQGTPYTIEGVA